MSESGIISDLDDERKKLKIIYGLCLAYTLLSFFMLGAAIKYNVTGEHWQDIATKFQIYTSLIAIITGLWAKNNESEMKINLHDVNTIEFYEQLDNNNPHAAIASKALIDQGRKITMREAKVMKKRLRNA